MNRWICCLSLCLLVVGPSGAKDSVTLTPTGSQQAGGLHLPYVEAGLSQRQAVLHLLNRFAYGPRPGEVEQVMAMGIERWTERQIVGGFSESDLNDRLARFGSHDMRADDLRRHYVNYGDIQKMAEKHGVQKPDGKVEAQVKYYNQSVGEYRTNNHIKTVDDLFEETRNQKLVRCVYAANQLREVMTDFWFNHFNVAVNNDGVRPNLLSYERDALRAHALGNFGELLSATAHHPAMLYYLNNAQSMSGVNVTTTLQARLAALPKEEQADARKGQPGPRRNGGLNENFGRELMELHSLGVDGGYTQTDVVELARCLTGWTVLYREANQPKFRQQVAATGLGYVQEGDFLFRADWHDARPKKILGVSFPPGHGYDEGERVLGLLAHHPSTAHFICKKLAARFISDDPSEELVKQMATAFQSHDGDIGEVLRTMVQSLEFWAEPARMAKVKSPLEFLVSSVRATGADQLDPGRAQQDWISRMGEPLYGCIPPTGYSERSSVWMSPGTLVNRINFAMQIAGNRVSGVNIDPFRLVPRGLPRDATSQKLLSALLPGVTPSPDLLTRLGTKLQEGGDGYFQRNWFQSRKPADYDNRREAAWAVRAVGVILGSPEFQRR